MIVNITFDANGKPPTIKQLMQQGYKRDDAKKLLDTFKSVQSTTAKPESEPDPEPEPEQDPEPVSSVQIYDGSSDPLPLRFYAEYLKDLEDMREQQANRFRALTRTEPDSDGIVRGPCLDPWQPNVYQAMQMVRKFLCNDKAVEDQPGYEYRPQKYGCCLEHDAIKDLEKVMKQHPLGPWVRSTTGVGLKQGARLIAAIGDPAIRPDVVDPNTGEIKPSDWRKLSELWQYCGHGSKSVKEKGSVTFWSPEAKVRTYLIANNNLQHASKYRKIYDDRREETAEKLHATECKRCGPSGSPAQPGSPWSKGHQKADALRITGKEVLRDMWLESRRLHGLD